RLGKAVGAAHACGIETSEVMVQLADLPTGRVTTGRAMQSPSQGSWECDAPEGPQLQSLLTDVAQGIVDAIDAGPGHDAQREDRFHGQREKSFHADMAMPFSRR